MSTTDQTTSPFPVCRKEGKWEVIVTEDGFRPRHVLCDTQEDAEAIADGPVLDHMLLIMGRCDGGRIRQAIDAYVAYGLESVSIVHRLRASAERQRVKRL